MIASDPSWSVRAYREADERGWVVCRTLSLLDTQYYDDVTPRRTVLTASAIALVAVTSADVVVGVLDIEIDGDAATIDTIATHPDHRGLGIATALLGTALPLLGRAGVTTVDAWTREDPAANRWYRRNGFAENTSYLHVYLGDGDDASGFATPEGLSSPVTAFVHGALEDEVQLRRRYRRVYVCRQYLRPVEPA